MDDQAYAEAKQAFSQTESVEAVIFTADVAVTNAQRGAARRKLRAMEDEIARLAREGRLEAARSAIEDAKWPGPQMMWWTTTIDQLAAVIRNHDDIVAQRRIAVGIAMCALTERVVQVDIWWDR